MNKVTALKVLGFSGKVIVKSSSIKSAYRALARKSHPDSPTGSHKDFKRVTEAYHVAQGIRDGTVFDLTSIPCRVKQGSSLFSYVVLGETVQFTYKS